MASDPQSPTPIEDDWSAQQADRIVGWVDTLKGYSTDKAVLALRAVVFGLVVVVLALASVVLLTVASVRMADAYLPIGAGVGDATWAAHLFVGSLLSIVGLGAWASRRGDGIPPKPLVFALLIDVAIVTAIVCYGIIQALT